jgi:hypothetical protein
VWAIQFVAAPMSDIARSFAMVVNRLRSFLSLLF